MLTKFTHIAAGSFGLFAIGCVSAPSSAYAGEWRFDPTRCPDLVEDWRDRKESRRDERINRGPLDRLEDRIDRRESRRDERVTVCPASSWVWDGPRRYRTARPVAAPVYYNWRDRRYYRYGPSRVRVAVTFR